MGNTGPNSGVVSIPSEEQREGMKSSETKAAGPSIPLFVQPLLREPCHVQGSGCCSGFLLRLLAPAVRCCVVESGGGGEGGRRAGGRERKGGLAVRRTPRWGGDYCFPLTAVGQPHRPGGVTEMWISGAPWGGAGGGAKRRSLFRCGHRLTGPCYLALSAVI